MYPVQISDSISDDVSNNEGIKGSNDFQEYNQGVKLGEKHDNNVKSQTKGDREKAAASSATNMHKLGSAVPTVASPSSEEEEDLFSNLSKVENCAGGPKINSGVKTGRN